MNYVARPAKRYKEHFHALHQSVATRYATASVSDALHVGVLVAQGHVLLPKQHTWDMRKAEAERKDAMEATATDLPLGHAEFRLRGKDGADALTIKAYTYADLAKIVGRLPVGLVFEVHLYCNGVHVGSGTYHRYNPHVEREQESGACVNLFQGLLLAASPSKNSLSPA
jgi:hypothetical protein